VINIPNNAIKLLIPGLAGGGIVRGVAVGFFVLVGVGPFVGSIVDVGDGAGVEVMMI